MSTWQARCSKTREVAKTQHKASFHFDETCNLAESKVDLLVFLSEKLDKFTQQGDIVDMQHAVLRFDLDTLRISMAHHATAHVFADSVGHCF